MNEINMLHHVVGVNEWNLSKSELYELNIYLYNNLLQSMMYEVAIFQWNLTCISVSEFNKYIIVTLLL